MLALHTSIHTITHQIKQWVGIPIISWRLLKFMVLLQTFSFSILVLISLLLHKRILLTKTERRKAVISKVWGHEIRLNLVILKSTSLTLLRVFLLFLIQSCKVSATPRLSGILQWPLPHMVSNHHLCFLFNDLPEVLSTSLLHKDNHQERNIISAIKQDISDTTYTEMKFKTVKDQDLETKI